MSEVLSYTVSDGVAMITLNRADKMNALNLDLFEALAAAGETVKADKTVRAVVLNGAGRAFCAGLDIEAMTAISTTDLAVRTHGDCNIFQQVAWVWREIDVPVIAAVHGTCFGGGLQIMTGADMRYVHPDTKLSIMEMKWGLVPDMAGTQLWKTFVREDIIRDLTYTARIFSGTEAYEYGFATRLTENPLEEALATAKLIANKNPDAIRAAKRLINDQHHADPIEGILAESIEQKAIIGSANQMEAVMANLEKRAPSFKDPE